jgi:hypothetical protein
VEKKPELKTREEFKGELIIENLEEGMEFDNMLFEAAQSMTPEEKKLEGGFGGTKGSNSGGGTRDRRISSAF